MSGQRTAFTILELVIVLAILGVVAGLLLPAILSSREKAREATCKNHLHQMDVALAEFVHAHQALPPQCPPGMMGGWTIDLLPFLEQKNLADGITPGTTIANASPMLLQPPLVMRCPSRSRQADPAGGMSSAHYVLMPVSGRQSYSLYDAPTHLIAPWATGPEIKPDDLQQASGPHYGGLFSVHAFQQGFGYTLNGRVVQ